MEYIEYISTRIRNSIRSIVAVIMTPVLTACLCDELPDTYRGADLEGCSEAGEVTCCSYSSSRCNYTLCQTGCGDPEEVSWYCL